MSPMWSRVTWTPPNWWGSSKATNRQTMGIWASGKTLPSASPSWPQRASLTHHLHIVMGANPRLSGSTCGRGSLTCTRLRALGLRAIRFLPSYPKLRFKQWRASSCFICMAASLVKCHTLPGRRRLFSSPPSAEEWWRHSFSIHG